MGLQEQVSDARTQIIDTRSELTDTTTHLIGTITHFESMIKGLRHKSQKEFPDTGTQLEET